MKKNYSLLALALACGLTSSAAPELQQFAGAASASELALAKATQSVRFKAPAKVAAEDVYGQYMVMDFWALSNMNGYLQNEMAIVKGDNPGEVKVMGMTVFAEEPLTGTFDEATGILSIPQQVVGKYTDQQSGRTYDVKYGLWEFAGEELEESSDPVTFQYQVSEAGVPMMIGQLSNTQAAGEWMAGLGGFSLYQVPEGIKRSVSNEGWVDCATEGTMTDAWMIQYPGFELHDTTPYSVKVQKSTTKPGVIRIVNPFSGNDPVAKFNESVADGYIEFDCSVEGVVVMHGGDKILLGQNQQGQDVYFYQALYPGFAAVNYNLVLYPINTEGYYVDYELFAPEDLIGGLDPEEMTTLVDNVITIPNVQFSQCPDTYKYYGGFKDWTATNTSIITLPADALGVNDIMVDESNAPVKYFNLQGVEVANPEQGSIVIKRQGSKTTKCVVK